MSQLFNRVLTAIKLPPLHLLLLVLMIGGCSRAPRNELIVGMELASPPFEMADTEGHPAGISVDIANALGESLGRKIEIQNMPFDGLIPALKTGRIDLIISSMTATPERAASIDFSDPYLKTGLCLLVAAKSNIGSIQDADQPGKTICVKKGTTGQLYALSQIQNARKLVIDREAACVLEVIQGKSDAFIYDQMSILKYSQANPDTTRAILKPFREESWAIGIQKGNIDLGNSVNKFVADYRAHGGFEALGDKYLKQEKKTFKKLGYPFFF